MKLRFTIKKRKVNKYNSLSDFLLHAPTQERKKILLEAARKANKDQKEIINQSEKIKLRNT